MTKSQTAIDNLACASCRYDLRALPLDSNCPECGHPIALSVNALPLTRWLPGYRRGVTFFAVAIFALTVGADWLYRNWFRIVGNLNIDHYAASFLVTAVILCPAAWWMSRPASFLRRNPARLRKPFMVLTAALVMCAALRMYLMMSLWPVPLFWGNVVALSITALMPLALDVEIWLLLTLLFRPLPIVPNSLPHAVVRGVQVLLIYTLVPGDIVFAMSTFARIAYLEHPLARGEHPLPTSWIMPLNILLYPAQKLRPIIWWVVLLVILHCRYRLQSRAGLWPPINKATSDCEV